MPLFGPSRSPPFEPFKSKTYLKCAKARGKQMTQKKQNENKQLAKELGGLLRDGKEEMARIRVRAATANQLALAATLARLASPLPPVLLRLACLALTSALVCSCGATQVELMIRSTNEVHALEIVELFCDLLLARHMLIESEAQQQIAAGGRMNAEPPPELQEAIFSLCWASGRAGVEELQGTAAQFALLYPKAFNKDEFGKPLMMMAPDGTQQAAADDRHT